MYRYALKRITYAVPIILGVSMVCFSMIHLAPGDPLGALVAPDAPAAAVEKLRKDYGLDRPIYQQYILWLTRALRGDIGVSLSSGRQVSTEIFTALTKTFQLAFVATIVGFTVGILLGSFAGFRRGSLVDRIATSFAITGVSVPNYWLGLVLVIVLSVQLNLLPSMGAGPDLWTWEGLSFLLLPALTLAVSPLGIITRTVRALVAEVLEQDFVEALRAKGLSERRVFFHVLRNAAPTALTVMGMQFAYLLGGSIIVETVFSWPGTGFLMYNAILVRDLPLLQGTVLVLATLFVLINLLVDLVQTVIDPRIRRT